MYFRIHSCNKRRSSLYSFTFSRNVGSTLVCVATEYSAPSSSSTRPRYTSVFFLAGPGPLHENEYSAFSRSPLSRANTLPFLPRISTSRKPRNVLPKVRFLVLVFPFLLPAIVLLSSTHHTSLRTAYLGLFLGPSTLHRLRYLTVFQLVLCYFVQYSPISYCHICLACSLLHIVYCHFNSLTSLPGTW